jgi:hypothetical protein
LTTSENINIDLTQAISDAARIRAEIQTRATSEESFDVQAAELSIVNAKIRELTIIANEGERIVVSSNLCQEFAVLVDASDLERLIGEPVVAVYMTKTPGDGENSDIWSINVNPKARVAVTKSATKGSGGSRKTQQFVVDGSEPMSAFDFSVAYATEADATNSLHVEVDGKRKWPTKPVFLDNAEAALVEAGHTVERIDPS